MLSKWIPLLVLLQLIGYRTWSQAADQYDSEINLPMRIGLRPLFNLAERSVDTTFTSTGYPDGWEQPNCGVRYRYKFTRGPLRLRAQGQTLELGFTGNYQIEGSTRACVSGVVISPWTPPCRCGFGETPRKVEVNFMSSLSIQPNYLIKLQINPQKPKPTDACKVCFWEQDITDNVMQGLEAEMLSSKQSIEKQYGRIDLRSHIISYWSRMNQPISLGLYGWLMIRPLGFRVNRLVAQGDSIDLSVGLRARPVVVSRVPQAYLTQVPADWDSPHKTEGFQIRLGVELDFDSLSQIINRSFMPVDIKPEKGPFRKNIRIDSVQLAGTDAQRLQCRLFLSGKYAGKLDLSGVPTWDSTTGKIRLREIDFDLSTRHRILGKSAAWFDRPIRKWLEQKINFDVASMLEDKRQSIEQQLNNIENGPISCRGELNHIGWQGLEVRRDGLNMRFNLQGKMQCKADLSKFSL
jgi:hypothetical protein